MADEQIIEVEKLVKHKLASLPQSTADRSIYKIPPHLLEVNEKAYLPSLVSIGPIHSQQSYLQLQTTQELKAEHLHCFLKATINRHTLKDYISFLRVKEEKARSYYTEKVSLSSNDFIQMLLIDAVFVINYLMWAHKEVRKHCPGHDLIKRRSEIAYRVNRDILLEDNQLPFFVLQDIYNMAFDTIVPFTCLISAFVLDRVYLNQRGISVDSIKERVEKESDIKHLVDFVWICIKPSIDRRRDLISATKAKCPRLCSSASNLLAAGVKFEATESNNVLDITFNEGVLRIPKITLQDSTESIFRSILAFEQCHHSNFTYFADYMIFLDSLINTPEDVNILVRSEIINNWLSSHYAVADFFNNITKYIIVDPENFYYSRITNGLNEHTSARSNRWKAILKRDYFSHPWAIISVIYAVILLFLTLLQTIGTFIP